MRYGRNNSWQNEPKQPLNAKGAPKEHLGNLPTVYVVIHYPKSDISIHPQDRFSMKPMTTAAERKRKSRDNMSKERRERERERDGKTAAKRSRKSREAKHDKVRPRALTSTERSRNSRMAKREREKQHQAEEVVIESRGKWANDSTIDVLEDGCLQLKQNEQMDIDIEIDIMEKLNIENEDDVHLIVLAMLSESTIANLVLVDSEVKNRQETAATKTIATTAERKPESRDDPTKERRAGNKGKDDKTAANRSQKSRAEHAKVRPRAMTSMERTRKCRAKQAREEQVREKKHQVIAPVGNLQFKQKEQTKDDISFDDISFEDIEGLGIESEEDVLSEVLTMIEGNLVNSDIVKKISELEDVVATEELGNFGFGERDFLDCYLTTVPTLQ